jgi:transposase
MAPTSHGKPAGARRAGVLANLGGSGRGPEAAQGQQHMRDHVTRHPELTRQQAWLTSIPGIGEMTATRLLAEMAPLERGQSARQAAAYTGLTPKHHESGSSVRGRSRLSTIGHARERQALYWPAIAA